MTLFVRYLAQAPSIAPIPSASGSGLWLAHRRVNPSGRWTDLSPVDENAALPATVTPESYSDNSQLETDEILASDDNGATWYISPSSTQGTTGAQSVPAFDTGTWTQATGITDNQELPLLSLDLGSFTSSLSPSFTFWLLNDTAEPFTSLSLEVRNVATGATYTVLDGRLSLGILGTFAAKTPGTGTLATGQQNTITYQAPPRSLNSSTLTLATGSAVKLEVTLSNFPASGLDNTSLAASVEVIPNRAVFPGNSFDDWLTGTVWQNASFQPPYVATGNTGNVTLNPVAIKLGSAIAVNWASKLVPLADGDWRLEATGSGRFVFRQQTDPVNGFPVCQFTLSAAGVVSNYLALASLRSPGSYVTPASPAPEAYRFVRVNSSGQLVTTVANEQPAGISVSGQPGFVGTGVQLLELGGSVAAGEALGSDATGLGVNTATLKPVVALASGNAGQRIPVAFLFGAGGGGGGASTFTGLTDTPADYTGAGSQYVRVNSGATALEFVTPPFAPLASPAFTGTPTAPTATAGTNTTQIATTEFVGNALPAVSFGTVTFSASAVAESASVTMAVSGTPPTGVTVSGGDTLNFASGVWLLSGQTGWSVNGGNQSDVQRYRITLGNRYIEAYPSPNSISSAGENSVIFTIVDATSMAQTVQAETSRILVTGSETLDTSIDVDIVRVR